MPIISNITILFLKNSGITYPVNVTLNCTSSAPNVLQVSPNCMYVYLDGSEKFGSQLVIINISYVDEFNMVHFVEVPFRVWMPLFPVTLQADTALNKIKLWQRYFGGKCVPRYQETEITALCNFSCGAIGCSKLVDITSFLGFFLSSNDTNVAQVFFDSNFTPNILAFQQGSVRITYTVNSNLLGFVDINVFDTEVRVERLQLSLIQSINISFNNFTGVFDGNLSNSKANAIVRIIIQENLTQEMENVYVFARILFSNGYDKVTVTYLLR